MARAAGVATPRRVRKAALPRAPKRPQRLTPAERVLAVLKDGEALEFKPLRSRAGLTTHQLCNVLVKVHGRDGQVMSRNGTGPRVYFLNPSPTPTAPSKICHRL